MNTTNNSQQAGFEKIQELFYLPSWLKVAREFVAILFWALSFVQLFAYDWMTPLSKINPIINNMIAYRVFIILLFVALLWFSLGTRRFIISACYVLLYPIVLIIWKMPKLLARNLPIVVGFLPAIHAFFSNLKLNFLFFSISLIAILFIFLPNTHSYITITSMLVIGLYLVMHFYQRFKIAFSSSTVYSIHNERLEKIYDKKKSERSEKKLETSTLDQDSDEYKQQYGNNLIGAYAASAAVSYIAHKFQNAQKSHILELYMLVSLLFTFLITVFVYAIEYYALYKLSADHFTISVDVSFISFIGYSFGSIIRFQLPGIMPSTNSAILLTYSEVIFAIAILIILASKIQTILRDRYKKDLAKLVDTLETQSQEVEKEMVANAALTMRGVESFILDFNYHLARILMKLRYGKDVASEIEKELAIQEETKAIEQETTES